MNTVQTIVEGLLAFCFLALTIIAWWKWSRDTAVMSTTVFVVATASMFVPMPVKAAFIAAWVILTVMMICDYIEPGIFTRLTAGKERAIVGTLSVIIALGVMAVAMYTKDQYVTGLTLLTMALAAYANRSYLRMYFNSQYAINPEVTPIPAAPRPVSMRATQSLITPQLPHSLYPQEAQARPNVVRDDVAERLEVTPSPDRAPVTTESPGAGSGVSAG